MNLFIEEFFFDISISNKKIEFDINTRSRDKKFYQSSKSIIQWSVR